jgi:hypothetical protein
MFPEISASNIRKPVIKGGLGFVEDIHPVAGNTGNK